MYLCGEGSSENGKVTKVIFPPLPLPDFGSFSTKKRELSIDKK